MIINIAMLCMQSHAEYNSHKRVVSKSQSTGACMHVSAALCDLLPTRLCELLAYAYASYITRELKRTQVLSSGVTRSLAHTYSVLAFATKVLRSTCSFLTPLLHNIKTQPALHRLVPVHMPRTDLPMGTHNRKKSVCASSPITLR